jgi:hypothetical protein
VGFDADGTVRSKWFTNFLSEPESFLDKLRRWLGL